MALLGVHHGHFRQCPRDSHLLPRELWLVCEGPKARELETFLLRGFPKCLRSAGG